VSDNPISAASEEGGGAVDAFLKEVAICPRAGGGAGRLGVRARRHNEPAATGISPSRSSAKCSTTAAQAGAMSTVYFRGLSECRASRFVSGGQGLALMSRSTAARPHADRQGAQRATRPGFAVGALIFIGDAMEESIDDLGAAAGTGLLGVKTFMFQEGSNSLAQCPFREIARSTGAYAGLTRARRAGSRNCEAAGPTRGEAELEKSGPREDRRACCCRSCRRRVARPAGITMDAEERLVCLKTHRGKLKQGKTGSCPSSSEY